ncbi:chorismate-binding protein [Shigella flexneri]
MHLVSRVVGELRKNRRAARLPRLHEHGHPERCAESRAMQLSAAAEGKRRGSYGGAVGYFTAHGDLDSCIVPRSAFVENGIATVQQALGWSRISFRRSEADETRNKARAVCAPSPPLIMHRNRWLTFCCSITPLLYLTWQISCAPTDTTW